MTLIGDEIINIDISENYKEPGVISIDNVDSTLSVYITELSNIETLNIITEPYIIKTNDIIDTSDILYVGVYNITYYSEDSSGNISYITRTLNISPIITIETCLNTNKIKQSVLSEGMKHNVNGETNTLSGGLNCTWSLDFTLTSFDYSNGWGIIIKGRAIDWVGGYLQINIDPTYVGWNEINGLNVFDNSISYITFKDSSEYFSNAPNGNIYWTEPSLPAIF